MKIRLEHYDSDLDRKSLKEVSHIDIHGVVYFL